jgi:hypothetical protein
LDGVVVARRQDQDDILVRLHEDQVAQVHLTWSQDKGSSSPWTELFPTLAAWRERVMVPDHQRCGA